jgi:pyrimidine deaminase RibD-like protein
MSSDTDEKYAKQAIDEADKCEPEDGAKPRPKVGAVLVSPDGKLLGSSYRGERVDEDQGHGDHAEYVLLGRKLNGRDLRGATLYTTLEPCVKRSPNKTPCAKRVIDAGISRVVVGMLDPNPDITGRGYWQLRRAGVVFSIFSGESQARAEAQNAAFSDPYRRFDSVFVSDLLEESASKATALIRTLDGLRAMLAVTRTTLDDVMSPSVREQLPQSFYRVFEDSAQWTSSFATRTARSVNRTLMHLDAIGHSSRRITEIRKILADRQKS